MVAANAAKSTLLGKFPLVNVIGVKYRARFDFLVLLGLPHDDVGALLQGQNLGVCLEVLRCQHMAGLPISCVLFFAPKDEVAGHDPWLGCLVASLGNVGNSVFAHLDLLSFSEPFECIQTAAFRHVLHDYVGPFEK